MKSKHLWLLAIIAVTVGFFLNVLNFGFVNFDDERIIVSNPFIRSFDFNHIKYVFTNFYDTLYQPLVLVSWMFDHWIGGGHPWPFHLNNLLLHLVNISLVWLITLRIFKHLGVAVLATLIFAIHPLNAESVAWASERKNLLYSLFFLLSIYQYLRYLDRKNMAAYLLCLLFFVLSLMSKPLAVTLAPVLFVLDYQEGRRVLSKNVIMEKIPFFVLSLLFGVFALMGPDSVTSVKLTANHDFFNRMIISGMAMITPVIHFFAPFRLSAFYPLPENIPMIYGVSIVFVFIFSLIILIYGLKKRKFILVTGILFYGMNIMVVCKIFGCQPGNNLTADHYGYLPVIGLIWIFSWIIMQMMNRSLLPKTLAVIVIAGYIGIIGFVLPARIGVWENSLTVWDDVLDNNPGHPWAMEMKGIALHKTGHTKEAMALFKSSLEKDPSRFTLYYNIGNIYLETGNTYEAYRNYNLAIGINPSFESAIMNKGLCLERMGYPEDALVCLSKALELRPDYPEARFNRAILLVNLKRYHQAMPDLVYLKKYLPRNADVNSLIGICKMMGKPAEQADHHPGTF